MKKLLNETKTFEQRELTRGKTKEGERRGKRTKKTKVNEKEH